MNLGCYINDYHIIVFLQAMEFCLKPLRYDLADDSY